MKDVSMIGLLLHFVFDHLLRCGGEWIKGALGGWRIERSAEWMLLQRVQEWLCDRPFATMSEFLPDFNIWKESNRLDSTGLWWATGVFSEEGFQFRG